MKSYLGDLIGGRSSVPRAVGRRSAPVRTPHADQAQQTLVHVEHPISCTQRRKLLHLRPKKALIIVGRPNQSDHVTTYRSVLEDGVKDRLQLTHLFVRQVDLLRLEAAVAQLERDQRQNK